MFFGIFQFYLVKLFEGLFRERLMKGGKLPVLRCQYHKRHIQSHIDLSELSVVMKTGTEDFETLVSIASADMRKRSTEPPYAESGGLSYDVRL